MTALHPIPKSCPHQGNGWCDPCVRELQDRIDELERGFDLRWKADMRAIKRWQKAHPGNDLCWPDHADLCVWLLEQLEKKRDRSA